MPETISLEFAVVIAAIILVSQWLGIAIGFVMGRRSGGVPDVQVKHFEKDTTEEQPGDGWTDMLEEPPPKEEQRIGTVLNG